MTHQVVQVGSEKSDSFNPLIQLLGLLSVYASVSLRVTEGKKRGMDRERKVKDGISYKSHINRIIKSTWAFINVRVIYPFF